MLLMITTADVKSSVFFVTADFDSCRSNPCGHGACIDALDSFTCQCGAGCAGEWCEVNQTDAGTMSKYNINVELLRNIVCSEI